MSLVVGKRCSPVVLYIALAIVVLALVVFAVWHGHNIVSTPKVPLHQP